ncbi:SUMF1/EgtB/PvdO family nonheme iron enzyme [bacterium]|nr:SUMF1/EgtB/PvdO family nonheme iron enzyme [bacterium]
MRTYYRPYILIASFLLVFVLIIFSCGRNNTAVGPDENSRAGSVRGQITYEGGKDFSGIIVTLEGIDHELTYRVAAAKRSVSADVPQEKISLSESDAMTTVTDKEGKYEFSSVLPGDYALTARRASDHLAKVANVTVAQGAPTVVNVVLTATGLLSGTADIVGSNNDSGILVYIAGTSYMAITDSLGAYTIIDVPLGVYKLVTLYDGYAPVSTTVTLQTAGAVVTAPVMHLSKSGVISGTVSSTSGALLSQVIVSVLNSDGTPSANSITTNSYGQYTLDPIPYGTVTVQFDAGAKGNTWKTGSIVNYSVVINDSSEVFDVHTDYCGWIYDARNKPPVAKIMSVQPIVVAGANMAFPSVRLRGVLSSDSDGSISSYVWSQVGGTAVTLSNSMVEDPYFTPPVPGDYYFSLVVKDNRGWESLPDTTVVKASSINMIEVKSGSFWLGQNGSEADEAPPHEVTLVYYEICQTEITQVQYEAVVGTNPSFFKGDTRPVEQVSWNDAVLFCNSLSSKMGLQQCYTEVGWHTYDCDYSRNGFRLPTEAEWEFACRAGKSTKYYVGDYESDLVKAAWYWVNSSAATHPVAQLQKSASDSYNTWGLYDMHGNVWEWCNDWYGSYDDSQYFGGSSENKINPIGPLYGSNHVVRGGSWGTRAEECRSENRHSLPTDTKDFQVGFRIVRRP